MSFRWIEYLTLAESLAVGDDSARVRSAVSRAYYAAFGTACDWLAEAPDSGFEMRDPGQSHAFVWEKFNKSHERKKRQIANFGFKLKAKRVLADYEASEPVAEADANLAIQQARTIIKLFDELRGAG